MTDDPNDFDSIIAQAEKRHRHEMDVLREASEIAKRLRGQNHVAPAPVKVAPVPAKPPIIVKRHLPHSSKGGRGVVQKSPAAPQATGLTAMVREAIGATNSTFTIRTISEYIVARKPELAEATYFMVGISAALAREMQRKKIRLVERGTAGNPSIYRNIPADGAQFSLDAENGR